MIAKKSKRKDVNTGGVWQQNYVYMYKYRGMIKIWWPVTILINRRLIYYDEPL